MKIYFAGSIRGGRSDASLYQEIISYLKKDHIVLTEHIGDLSLSALEGDFTKDEMIYLQDTNWLKEADILIAECSNPSLGVGYELAYAEKLGIPSYIFYDRKRTQLSAMLKGNSYFKIYGYDKKEEIFEIIDEIFLNNWL